MDLHVCIWLLEILFLHVGMAGILLALAVISLSTVDRVTAGWHRMTPHFQHYVWGRRTGNGTNRMLLKRVLKTTRSG